MTIAGPILSRLLKAAITLLAIAILNFFLVHAAPGDPAAVLAGEAGAAAEPRNDDLRGRVGRGL